MATPINAPMAGEIWHLSIEDLFQSVQEAPRLGGDGPFVINLSVSTAPISVPTKAFTKHANAHVYQIQVTEDGRPRFRLRLGPFATEDQADAILAEVRETYPGALTATASGSDLRVIASLQAKVEHRQAAAQKTAEKVQADRTVGKVPAQKTADAEISIDIAWPTPELGVPPKAPPRAAPPVAPPVTVKVVSAPVAVAVPTAPTATAAVAAAPVPAPAPTPAAPAPAAAPVTVAAPKWALPELDILLPPAVVRPAAPAPLVKETAAPSAKPSAANFTAPLAIVKDAPLLTEIVMPIKKAAPKNKPAAAALAPTLTDAVMLKSKPPSAPAAAAKRITPSPAVSAPAPIAAKTPPAAAAPKVAPKVVAPVVAPTVIPSTVIATVTTAPVITAPAITTPVSAPKAAAAAPAVPKSVVVPVRAQAAPVLTQSVAPRNAAGYKARGGITKPFAPNKLTSLQHVVVATAPAPAPREVKELDEPLESLESTQTIRALTPKELEDNESRWFVIQLSYADHAFDPDSVPNLDIFSEYRLYSVAGLDQGRVVHALRLGFFREEIAAVAVASYLAAYWEKPAIKRVSVAERERFASQRVDARKDVGATGKHAVIEITDELIARRRKSSKAAAAYPPPQHPIEH